MRTLVAVMLGASALLASSASRAQEYGDLSFQELPKVSPQDPPAPTHWYGYEILATDGAALLLAVPALASNSSTVHSVFGVGSLMTYGLGAPIVHFTHGRVGAGFADLGLRVGMPLVLGLFGGMIGSGSYQPIPCNTSSTGAYSGAFSGLGCGLDNGIGQVVSTAVGAAVGSMIGIGIAVAIDAAVIAREPVRLDGASHDAKPSRRIPRAATHIEPTFGLTPEPRGGTRATVGLLGVF
jgi:hypothetical protein